MQPEQPWPITAEDRQKSVAVLLEILDTGTPLERIEAVRVLVEMDAMNLKSESDSAWLPKPNQN